MDFNEYYKIGEEYYENGEYQKALKHFKKCISIYDYYDCLDYIGLCYLRLKRYESAIKIFQEIMDNCPESIVPIINLGRAYLYEGSLHKALEMFNKAVEIDSNDEDANFYLGVYNDKIESYEEAIKYYKKSLNINDEQSETHLNLGIDYYRLNLYNDALKELDAAYKYDNECIDAKKDKVLIYIDTKEYRKALYELMIIIKYEPNDIINIVDISHCYEQLQDFENAYEWINKAAQIDPEDEYIKRTLNRIKLQIK